MDGEESRDLVRQFFTSLLEKHRATAEV